MADLTIKLTNVVSLWRSMFFLVLYNSLEYKPPSFHLLSESENTKQSGAFFLFIKKIHLTLLPLILLPTDY